MRISTIRFMNRWNYTEHSLRVVGNLRVHHRDQCSTQYGGLVMCPSIKNLITKYFTYKEIPSTVYTRLQVGFLGVKFPVSFNVNASFLWYHPGIVILIGVNQHYMIMLIERGCRAWYIFFICISTLTLAINFQLLIQDII